MHVSIEASMAVLLKSNHLGKLHTSLQRTAKVWGGSLFLLHADDTDIELPPPLPFTHFRGRIYLFPVALFSSTLF